MGRPTVSIIICTRDRAESLRATLASVAATNVPVDLDAELVVVDNGSQDITPQVIAAAPVVPRLPVRGVDEPAAGLSNARNAGLRHTASDAILFTDDDVRVPADWIEGMCRPILRGEADAVAGGVHFPPEYERPLAREPFRYRRGWLASTEGLDPADPRGLVGANMAFSRRVADALGGFDPALGAGGLGFGEESLFAQRLVAAGYHIRGELGVSVAHHFDLSRLTVPALVKMAEKMGRSTAYLDYHCENADVQAARSQIRRARFLFACECLLRPWRAATGRKLWQITQRTMTFAYWRQLATYAGQPRRYSRRP